MTDHDDPLFRARLESDITPAHSGGDQIGPLLRLAGPREAVPVDRMQRVKAAVHAEWRQQSRTRSRQVMIRWTMGAVAAALLLVAVRLAVRPDIVAPGPARTLASIEALSGAALLISSSSVRGEDSKVFQIGDGLREGDGVDTTRGGSTALRLAGGASVRVDRGTRVRLTSESTMVLDEGTIYIDSEQVRGDQTFEVQTPVGIARDIGTRFEVRFDGSALRVRVRDGLVRLSLHRESHDARPGEQLTVDGQGRVERRIVPVHGPDWAWSAALARPFSLEGRSLRQFLDWIAGENGWQVRFADAAVERKSHSTTLHGSIEGLTPEEALDAVLPTSGVDHRLENGVLGIRMAAGGAKN